MLQTIWEASETESRKRWLGAEIYKETHHDVVDLSWQYDEESAVMRARCLVAAEARRDNPVFMHVNKQRTA